MLDQEFREIRTFGGPMPADIVIRGGSLVDGTGAPARTGDVAEQDGDITEVAGGRGGESRRVGDTGNRELDGDGLLLARDPGRLGVHQVG